MSLQINPHVLSLLARVSVICGFRLDEVLAEVAPEGYDTADEAPFHLSLAALQRLHEVAIAHSTRAYFPFTLASYFAFDHAPELDAYLASSQSLRHILPVLRELPILLHPALRGDFAVEGEELQIRLELSRDGQRLEFPSYLEIVISVMTRLMEQVMGRPIDFAVHFRHQPLVAVEEYVRQFHARPAFGAAFDGVCLPVHWLDEPLPQRSATLHAKARLRLERRLQELQMDAGLGRTVEVLLSQNPALTMAAASARLKRSERSLQRGLQEAGTSFSSLQSQVRRRVAEAMLLDRDLDIDAISAKLGFADRSSFSRAFSKWTGMSPQRFRRQGVSPS